DGGGAASPRGCTPRPPPARTPAPGRPPLPQNKIIKYPDPENILIMNQLISLTTTAPRATYKNTTWKRSNEQNSFTCRRFRGRSRNLNTYTGAARQAPSNDHVLGRRKRGTPANAPSRNQHKPAGKPHGGTKLHPRATGETCPSTSRFK